MKITVFSCLLLLLLAGCNPMNAVSGKTEQTDADGDPVYRKNPQPTQAYRITMTIEDAPGPFAHVSGTAFYDMTNHVQCTPINEPLLGMSTKQKEDVIPIHFQKIDETTYVGTIYADGMVDADYYGKGVCRFELTGVGIALKATGKHDETRFEPALFKKEIYSPEPKVTYFWKGRYPKVDMDDFPDSGRTSVDDFNETARHNIFKVTLSSHKESP
ncbi:hypothetical protein [Xanthomonas theicola]|uniref:Lipoprotein n=1 Tax=Xanthomonas theicola TaxID=56464 RepID=A0A2S6ZL19_9XANT|nr:hypothetical protein [Xanthomonas theicola]PPT92963.1 hypothetical protein XthCFBP4691_01920 [Xanthomonas theicola]QNH23778.1 hypothetical protein G4Q83_01960 [Xanthomonas theicola]